MNPLALWSMLVASSSFNLPILQRTLSSPKTLINIGFRSAVPDGIVCTKKYWCSKTNICAEICDRGSVVIPPWQDFAVRTQTALARRSNICAAQFIATHNSAITAADGFGVLDAYFTHLLHSSIMPDSIEVQVSSSDKLSTINQYLSITDQMQLGVRLLEVDVHFVKGDLRIAHCGNRRVDSDLVDSLLSLIEGFAGLAGRKFLYDTSQIGCFPSLSSVPADEQRLFRDLMGEVRAWADRPENSGEFLVIYLDSTDLLTQWGLIPRLISEITGALGRDSIYTRLDRDASMPGVWPTMEEMVGAGKRFVLMTRRTIADPVFFPFYELCGWEEPSRHLSMEFPDCSFRHYGRVASTQRGLFTRMVGCEIEYGPLNCDGKPGPNTDLLDEASIPRFTKCGVNAISPDLLTTRRAEAFIWSFAPREPASLFGGASAAGRRCIVQRATDGRWEERPCPVDPSGGAGGVGTACRAVVAEGRGLGGLANVWTVEAGPRGICPRGSEFSVPVNGYENEQLRVMAAGASFGAAWLPLDSDTGFKLGPRRSAVEDVAQKR